VPLRADDRGRRREFPALPKKSPKDDIMTQAKRGDTVRINYTGRLTDGTTFDSSEGREPLQFTLGAGQVITGLENRLEGMEVGSKDTVTIPADEAYGPRSEEAVQTVERTQLPQDIDVAVGTQLQARTPEGRVIPLTVIAADDNVVKLDANHPLAGKDLVFDVELVEIVQAA
jgi:peptidylprolyl isomerase